ncbi:MAG: 6-hydroxymethylpterin diphosphokinase MptE-like protein [Exilispira sp.]
MKLDKSLLYQNLIKIKDSIPYIEYIIGKLYFNKIEEFRINDENCFSKLYDLVYKIKEEYDIKIVDDKFYVPIKKENNKKIHSIYNPLKEKINIDEIKEEKICFEIYGIGFLYSLYGIKTKKIYNDINNISNNFNNNIEISSYYLSYFINKILNQSQIRFILIDESLDLFLLSCSLLNISDIFDNNIISIYIKGLIDDDFIRTLLIDNYIQLLNPLFIDKIIKKENPNCFLKNDIEKVIDEWETVRKEVIFYLKTNSINTTFNLKNAISNLNAIINNNNLYNIVNKELIKDLSNYIHNNFIKYKKEALIIGASPTLDFEEKRQELLNKINIIKPFIVCVDNGINFCINNKIFPDLIIILDNRNIVDLMLNKMDEKYKKIPVLMPVSSSRKLLLKFENPILFIDKYLFIILLSIENISRYFYSEKSIIKFEDVMNKINEIILKLPILNLSVKNVGAFAYLFIKNFNFNNIFLYGIDFSFPGKKYYYKNSYFYEFNNSRQSYLKTTMNSSVISCIRKGEKYLFEQYLKEWKKIESKNLEFEYFTKFKLDINDKDITKILINFLLFYYLRNENIINVEKNFEIFIFKLLKNLYT